MPHSDRDEWLGRVQQDSDVLLGLVVCQPGSESDRVGDRGGQVVHLDIKV